MLIAALDGETIDTDRLPGSFVPWHAICANARCVRYDEVAGIIYVWDGDETVNVYDTCARLIDFWRYPCKASLQAVLKDMQTRFAGC